MLPVLHRISLPSDFYKIKKFGKRISNNYFSISYITDSSLKNSVFSVIVAKVIAKKSSDRNKLKRITKGLLIKNRAKLPYDLKCLIFPKITITSIKNRELEIEFLKLFDQIR
jgi:ribonuclease P protein component